MKITNSWFEQSSGLQATAEYEDMDDFSCLPYEKCSQVVCFAFCQNKMLLVYDKKKKRRKGVRRKGVSHLFGI
ncbi:hypothetical protein KKG48_00085 [Patescibacteria group bacterium]|nr:hypothetical protein [Nanoarchaeota archaeon]MBU4479829.1 hypothetical protein [Patescibacteria group bacterium]MCG2694675.1 hypothetical protein [Candidatus Parcubacteria bacterium]